MRCSLGARASAGFAARPLVPGALVVLRGDPGRDQCGHGRGRAPAGVAVADDAPTRIDAVTRRAIVRAHRVVPAALGVRAIAGLDIGIGRAIGRFVGYLISSFVLSIGLIWAAFDPRKQGWHDKMASTFVVRKV